VAILVSTAVSVVHRPAGVEPARRSDPRGSGISDTQVSLLLGPLLRWFMGSPVSRSAGWPTGTPAAISSSAVVIVWTIGTLVCGFSQSFGAVIRRRLVVGTGRGGVVPCGYFADQRLLPAEPARNSRGLFPDGIAMGIGAAILIGGGVVAFRTGRRACGHAVRQPSPVANGVAVDWRARPAVGAGSSSQFASRCAGRRSTAWTGMPPAAVSSAAGWAKVIPIYIVVAIASLVTTPSAPGRPRCSLENSTWTAPKSAWRLGIMLTAPSAAAY